MKIIFFAGIKTSPCFKIWNLKNRSGNWPNGVL